MFTGLVEGTGTVTARTPGGGGLRVRIETAIAPELQTGDSVAVNGVCLTVTRLDDGGFEADVGPETMRVSTLGDLGPGTRVNLERPLRADSRLGGHFVQGHVDGIGRIEGVRSDADFTWITIGFPAVLAPYLIRKGSVAVDGISLTVARLDAASFDVMVVPYTRDHTNLSDARSGGRVNIECDMIGKYVVRAASLAGLRADPADGTDATVEART